MTATQRPQATRSRSASVASPNPEAPSRSARRSRPQPTVETERADARGSGDGRQHRDPLHRNSIRGRRPHRHAHLRPAGGDEPDDHRDGHRDDRRPRPGRPGRRRVGADHHRRRSGLQRRGRRAQARRLDGRAADTLRAAGLASPHPATDPRHPGRREAGARRHQRCGCRWWVRHRSRLRHPVHGRGRSDRRDLRQDRPLPRHRRNLAPAEGGGDREGAGADLDRRSGGGASRRRNWDSSATSSLPRS